MPTVGEQLREAREGQGLSVAEVAERTKIKVEHVLALESGDYNSFAAPIYIRGFVRTYATLLKLDSLAVMADLDLELAHTEKFSGEPSLSGPPQGLVEQVMFRLSRMNMRFVIPVLALVFVMLAAIWGLRRWQEQKHADPLRNLGPGVYQSGDDVTSQTLPLPSNKQR